MAQINHTLLEERISRETTHIDGKLLSSIKNFVENGEPAELAAINPNRLALKIKEDNLKTLKAFLYLTKAGVFDMEWAVHCPHCNGTQQLAPSLAGIQHEGRCGACVTTFEAEFDKHTEIRFKINPSICETGNLHPFDVNFFSHETEPGITIQIEPHMVHFLELDVNPGIYVLANQEEKKLQIFRVADEKTNKTQKIEVLYSETTPSFTNNLLDKPGTLSLTIKNETNVEQEFLFSKLKEPDWTSAALVSTLQEFRDLFSE